MKGWVYVTSNAALPGLIKIGFSSKDPKVRAAELDLAGIPEPHIVEYEALVQDPRSIEQAVHHRLSEYRHRKEFFRCEVAVAVATIRELVGDGALLEELRQPIADPSPEIRVTYYDGLKMTFWEDGRGRSGALRGNLSPDEVKRLI